MNLEPAYIALLINANHLDADRFSRPVFFPGMLFGSFETWWGKNSRRASSHEGVDICFFAGTDKRFNRFDETVRVPVMAGGRVIAVIEDLLGKTVVVRHEGPGGVIALYAHVRPEPGLTPGDTLECGEICAVIAGTTNRKTPLLPHLHISMAHEHLMPGGSVPAWPVLNRLDRAAFIDPLPQLFADYEIRPYDPDQDLAAIFQKPTHNRSRQWKNR